jgi:molybdate transport system substrate-binding protein
VLAALGVTEALIGRMREYPNGQTALTAMAAEQDANLLGCTQITEILNAAGVDYAGDLPAEHGLVTTYTAAAAKGANAADQARHFIAIPTAPEHASVRARGVRRLNHHPPPADRARTTATNTRTQSPEREESST